MHEDQCKAFSVDFGPVGAEHLEVMALERGAQVALDPVGSGHDEHDRSRVRWTELGDIDS